MSLIFIPLSNHAHYVPALYLFVELKEFFFCAYDVKFGAIANGVKIFNKKNSMFRPKIIGGIEEKFFSQLLKDFFKLKR